MGTTSAMLAAAVLAASNDLVNSNQKDAQIFWAIALIIAVFTLVWYGLSGRRDGAAPGWYGNALIVLLLAFTLLGLIYHA